MHSFMFPSIFIMFIIFPISPISPLKGGGMGRQPGKLKHMIQSLGDSTYVIENGNKNSGSPPPLRKFR